MANAPLVRLMAQKWEYKVLRKGSDARDAISLDELQALGIDGWEMCGCFANSLSGPFFTHYYFKRPL